MATHRLSTEHLVYAMPADSVPAVRVHSGDTVLAETAECFENQVQSEVQPCVSIDWGHINPATGPICGEEAEPGDRLAVFIERIEPADQGAMTTGSAMGVFGDELRESAICLVPIADGLVHVLNRAHPANPMIGVIGTAPEREAVPNGAPG